MLNEVRHITRGRKYADKSVQDVMPLHEAEDKQDVEIMSADEVSAGGGRSGYAKAHARTVKSAI